MVGGGCQRPGQVTFIVDKGPAKLEHVQANVQAAGWRLTREELAEVNAVLGQT